MMIITKTIYTSSMKTRVTIKTIKRTKTIIMVAALKKRKDFFFLFFGFILLGESRVRISVLINYLSIIHLLLLFVTDNSYQNIC